MEKPPTVAQRPVSAPPKAPQRGPGVRPHATDGYDPPGRGGAVSGGTVTKHPAQAPVTGQKYPTADSYEPPRPAGQDKGRGGTVPTDGTASARRDPI